MFGNSVVANGKIVATNGNAFNNSSYNIVSTTMYDDSTNQVILPIGMGTATNVSRTLLTSSPQTLMTVRMLIQTCNLPVGILFADQTSQTSYVAQHTPAANSHWSVSVLYDNLDLGPGINDASCKPIITSFSSNTPGGIGAIVIIDGNYFGNAKDILGTVVYRNADKGNRYPTQSGNNWGGIQAYDIVSWDDDQIQIELPNFIDSAWVTDIVGGTPTLKLTDAVPGSGLFKVRNFTGAWVESTNIINIPYSVTQFSDFTTSGAYVKSRAMLATNHGDTAYRVQLRSDVVTTLGSKATDVVKKAMHDWSCTSGINWFLDADTNMTGTPVNDNFCTVYMSSNLPSLGRCDPSYWTCPGTPPIRYLEGFDIVLRTNPSSGTYTVDTIGDVPNGKYDFYSIVSHEFGHAHQIDHCNDSIIELMWWQANPFGYQYNNRKLVRKSPDSRTGAEWYYDHELGVPGCIGTHVEWKGTGCEEIELGIDGYADYFSTVVFPNPSTGRFRLGSGLGDCKLEARDISGRIVFNGMVKGGQYFDLHESGLYIVTVTNGNSKHSLKLIVE